MTTLEKELLKLVKNEATNTKPPRLCSIKKVYDDKKYADITLENGELKYIKLLGGNAKAGDNALLIYLDENCTDCIAISINYLGIDEIHNKIESISQSNIKSQGIPYFHINSDGDLIAEYGFLKENIFSINNNGDLIVTLPDGQSNVFSINENGDAIYTEEA